MTAEQITTMITLLKQSVETNKETCEGVRFLVQIAKDEQEKKNARKAYVEAKKLASASMKIEVSGISDVSEKKLRNMKNIAEVKLFENKLVISGNNKLDKSVTKKVFNVLGLATKYNLPKNEDITLVSVDNVTTLTTTLK